KISTRNPLLFLSCIFLCLGHLIRVFSYDYSATTKCLAEPRRAHYGGGIIVNPELDHGIQGWNVFGHGAIRGDISKEGNGFIVAHNRTHPWDSMSQKVQIEEGKLYSFSAWFQVSKGSETISIVLANSDGELIRGGQVIAKHGCWSLLKGGITANFSGLVEIFFETKNPAVDIWVDNISLQPFTAEQWRAHQQKSIDKVRKSKVTLQVTYSNRTAVEGAKLSIKQAKSGFPFGCGMNFHILESTAYQNWFTSRFKFATFTNEMKWYTTETKQGIENYTLADAMLNFAKDNGISVRGHNILWDNPKEQPNWVKNLSPDDLRKAATQRIQSVVSRYAGQVIAWDVVNENLHFSFFEDNLGKNASAEFYAAAYKLDRDTIMFMNEYNTIEYSKDMSATPDNYKKKMQELLSFPGTAGMKTGIGLQGHFGPYQPNIAYMRSSLDILGSMRLPIWLTEVDVGRDPDQVILIRKLYCQVSRMYL
ncbi:Glyco_hydro_10 domain-containing protein, partial [Cephalotus follicularis]